MHAEDYTEVENLHYRNEMSFRSTQHKSAFIEQHSTESCIKLILYMTNILHGG